MKKYIEVCKNVYKRGNIKIKPDQTDLYFYEYNDSLYYSIFDHTEEYKRYFETHTNDKEQHSVEGYDGPISCEFVPFDFDGQTALDDIKKVLQLLLTSEKTLIDDINIFFSGNKGFHLFIKSERYIIPDVNHTRVIKGIAEKIKNKVNAESLDLSIYKKTGILRSPNSRHEKTKLYKIPLFPAELYLKSLETIRVLAVKKRYLLEEEELKNWLISRGWHVK
jgi:hypothetical protein